MIRYDWMILCHIVWQGCRDVTKEEPAVYDYQWQIIKITLWFKIKNLLAFLSKCLSSRVSASVSPPGHTAEDRPSVSKPARITYKNTSNLRVSAWSILRSCFMPDLKNWHQWMRLHFPPLYRSEPKYSAYEYCHLWLSHSLLRAQESWPFTPFLHYQITN